MNYTTPSQWFPYSDKFDLFPKLPAEIRLMIWEATLKPRIVGLRLFELEHSYESRRNRIQGLRTPEPLPTALMVCQESRNHLLPRYERILGNMWFEPLIRFNFELDTLYLAFDIVNEFPMVFSMFWLNWTDRRLRHLAIQLNSDYWSRLEHDAEDLYWEDFYDCIGHLGELREVTGIWERGEPFRTKVGLPYWPDANTGLELYEKLPPHVEQLLEYAELLDFDSYWKQSQLLPTLPNFNTILPSKSLWGWRREEETALISEMKVKLQRVRHFQGTPIWQTWEKIDVHLEEAEKRAMS